MENNLTYISIDKLIPHPQNPRKQLGDLTELADNIRHNGVYQNLTVVDNGDDTYTIIIGHRRHAAAKIAGLTELPCVIAQMNEHDQLETMLVENMQRSDLTVIEEAQGLQLMIDLGDTVADIATSTGFSKSKIQNRLRLNQYDIKSVEKAFKNGATLEDYAKLSRIKDDKTRKSMEKYLGTSNFDFYVDSAIRKERWNKKRAEITSVLKSLGAEESDRFITNRYYDKCLEVRSADAARDFCKENLEERPIKYYSSDFNYYVEIYFMKFDSEVKISGGYDSDGEYQKARQLEKYRKSLIGKLDDYINAFILSFNDNEYLASEKDKTAAKCRTIEHLLELVFIFSIENSHNYGVLKPLDALKILGFERKDLTDKSSQDATDIDFDIHTEDPAYKTLWKKPIRLLLSLLRTWIYLDGCSEYYYYCSGEDRKKITFRKQAQPARFIEELEHFGFKTPDELKQYIDGTHPMYTVEGCEDIIAELSSTAEKTA